MRRQPWLNYLILIIIVAAASYFLYFKPKGAEVKTLRAEREKIEVELKELRAKKQELDKIELELAAMSTTLKELEAIIPLKKEIDVILRKIQEIAYDSRLNILRFAPQGEIRKEFYSEWPIPIEISGSYHNLGLFFDRLRTFARLFTIDKFAINALSNQTDDLTISSSFTAKTYMFLEEEALKEETSAKPKARKK